MLGLAIVLIDKGLLNDDEIKIPDDLPFHFLSELDKILPRKETTGGE